MFDGIQFHFEFGVTTTTSCCLPSMRRRCRAAVCPAMPAPRITTRAIDFLLEVVTATRRQPPLAGARAYPTGYMDVCVGRADAYPPSHRGTDGSAADLSPDRESPGRPDLDQRLPRERREATSRGGSVCACRTTSAGTSTTPTSGGASHDRCWPRRWPPWSRPPAAPLSRWTSGAARVSRSRPCSRPAGRCTRSTASRPPSTGCLRGPPARPHSACTWWRPTSAAFRRCRRPIWCTPPTRSPTARPRRSTRCGPGPAARYALAACSPASCSARTTTPSATRR